MTSLVLASPAASTAVDPAVAVWDDVLRGYAAVLDEQRSLLLAIDLDEPLEAEVLAVPTFDPPAGMPPMPISMRSRAHALIAETEGLAELARTVLAALPAPNRRPSSPTAAGGDTVDQRI